MRNGPGRLHSLLILMTEPAQLRLRLRPETAARSIWAQALPRDFSRIMDEKQTEAWLKSLRTIRATIRATIWAGLLPFVPQGFSHTLVPNDQIERRYVCVER